MRYLQACGRLGGKKGGPLGGKFNVDASTRAVEHAESIRQQLEGGQRLGIPPVNACLIESDESDDDDDADVDVEANVDRRAVEIRIATELYFVIVDYKKKQFISVRGSGSPNRRSAIEKTLGTNLDLLRAQALKLFELGGPDVDAGVHAAASAEGWSHVGDMAYLIRFGGAWDDFKEEKLVAAVEKPSTGSGAIHQGIASAFARFRSMAP